MAKLNPDYIKWVLTLNATQAREEYHKLEVDNRELAKQTTAARKAMAELEAQGKKNSDEWNRLSASIKENDKAVRENKARMDELFKRFDLSSMTLKELKKHLKDLNREFENTSKATHPERYAELQRQIAETKAAIAEAKGETKELEQSFFSLSKIKSTLIGFFAAIGMVILNQVIGAFKNLKNTIMEFSAENSKLAAILRSSKEDIKELTEQAKELGRTTSATATEVTSLQIELAKLGFTTDEILKMTPAVLKFSKTVGTDLASAAAFSGSVLRIFGKDASDTEDVLASLAVSTTASALDFSKLQTSMATVGPVANTFGFALEDTVAMLGVLANQGFDASSAATALRNIMLKLCDSNSELSKAFGEPVHSAADMSRALQKLKDDGVDLEKALELTDKRSVAAFTAIMNSAADIDTLRESITSATDDFNAMSATMADNAASAEKGFFSAIEGLILRFGGLDAVIQGFYNTMTGFVSFVAWVIDAFTPLAKVIGWVLTPFRLMISAIGQVMGYMSKWSSENKVANGVLTILKGLVTALVSALALYKIQMMASTLWTKLMSTALMTKIKAVFADVKATNLATAAQKAWNLAMSANPIGLVVAALAGLVIAVMAAAKAVGIFTDKTRELGGVSAEHNKVLADANVKYETEREKLEKLIKVAKNEGEEKKNRIKAINELNRIIPGYNAQLDEESGRYRANEKALRDYLSALKDKLLLEANRDELSRLMAEREKDRREQWNTYIDRRDNGGRKTFMKKSGANYASPGAMAESMRDESDFRAQKVAEAQSMDFNQWYESQARDADKAVKKLEKYLDDNGLDLSKLDAPANGEGTDSEKTPLTPLADDASKVVDRLKEIKAELKSLRKMEPETDEEYEQIQKRIKALQEEKRLLEGKQKNKKGSKKHEAGTYGEDSLDEATAGADDAHQKRLLEINKRKGELSETELAIQKNKELIQYCVELNESLETLKNETDASHTQTLDKITSEQNKLFAQMLKAQQELDSLNNKQIKENYDKRVAANQAYYDTQELKLKEAIAKGLATQDAANAYLQAQQTNLHKSQLKDLQDYYDNVKAADTMGLHEKSELMAKLESDIRKAQSQVLTDTAKWSMLMREATANTASPAGIKANYDMQIASATQYYNTLIEIAAESGEDTVALEEAKQRKIEDLNYKYLEETYKLQEMTGLSWADEYDRELAKLKHMHAQGILSEEDYQKARLQIGVSNAKKYFDYYANLSASMFSAIQDAEIAASEAKYDVLIRQAENAGQDTTKLEEEKEAEKLRIQKKYADVDFAIKVSEIVANTAVAIMTAYKQLGPVAGAIAAVMLGATGLAQAAKAEAERKKIKNMQPGKSSGNASPANAQRVLKGYSDGGYTGDGGRYEVAGVVHRGEYVVPMPIMGDRRVIDAVGVIESIRRRGVAAPVSYHGNPSGGYASGGYTGDPGMAEAIAELRVATSAIRDQRVVLVWSDLEEAKRVQVRAQSPFKRS